MPVPRLIPMSTEDPAGLGPLGKDYVQNGTIYTPAAAGGSLGPTHNRERYWHEVGHLVDSMMPDQMRQVVARDILGGSADQWDGDGRYAIDDTVDSPLRETFAEAYAGLVLNKPGGWDEAYKAGYVGPNYAAKPIPLKKMEQLRQILSTLARDGRFRPQPKTPS